MSEVPEYYQDNMLASTVAQFPSGTMFHAFSTPIYATRIKDNLDAIVCSPHEVKSVKKYFNKEIITPGIRISSKVSDQKRVMTPKDAFKQGSDWLVIGRDLTEGNIKNNFKKLSDHLS